MRNNDLFPTLKDEPESVIYVNGLGFINRNNTSAIFSLLRVNSNIIAFCLLVFFFLQKSFILPVTYLVYFFGANIQINYYTGLIVSSPLSKITIVFFANFAALFFSTLIATLVYRRQLSCARIFTAPHQGITSLAVPITVAVGFVGIGLGLLMYRVFEEFGIVFSTISSPIKPIFSITCYALAIGLIFSVLEEIFFRGVILTSLRQFGDGFAVIVTSLVFAIWGEGFSYSILYFFLSLPLSYFAIRSGSVYTPIISRIIFQLIVFCYQLCLFKLEYSLALVVIFLSSVLIMLFAAYCFITFIKTDKNAFHLKPPSDKLGLTVKLTMFSSGLVFILLVVFQFIRIIKSTQIIG